MNLFSLPWKELILHFLLFIVSVLLWCLVLGCARFSTVQQDIRYNEETHEKTTVTTKVTAWTCFTAKSELAKFRASQTEKTQSANVGTLGLSSEVDTNLAVMFGTAAGTAVKIILK